MARRKAREIPPGEWRYTVGEPPVQVTAYERPDKGNAIYARVWDGRRYTQKKALRGPIRDAHGAVDPAEEISAQQLALARLEAVRTGLTEEDLATGPLTLPAGFRRVLHPKTGKYVGKSDHIGDVTRYAKRITSILGRELLWSQVRHAHYRKLWRALAEEYAHSDTYGLRQGEVIVGVLQSAARWLQTEGYIEPGTALPAPGWKAAMEKEWAQILDAPAPEAAAPRYTEAESRKLWQALPGADPRLHLAMEIGAELRLGQVLRVRRSDVRSDAGGELYSVTIHGRGKKLGEVVVLTPEQRAVLAHHLTEGYLREYEAEHQAGRLADYPLFPGGRLRYWRDGRKLPSPVAQEKNAARVATETALAKWWKDLERRAEVKEMAGRRWYGMRRLQSDLAEDVESDARVLNRMGGWKHTATRERYQEKGRTKVQEKAAAARRKIRPGNDLGPKTDTSDA